MKQTLIIFASVLLFSCKDKTKAPTEEYPADLEVRGKLPTDSTQTYAEYVWNLVGVRSMVMRVIKDTVMVTQEVQKDSSVVTRKKALRDTFYSVPVQDTARDATGRARRDSAGRVYVGIFLRPIDKKYIIQDFNKKF